MGSFTSSSGDDAIIEITMNVRLRLDTRESFEFDVILSCGVAITTLRVYVTGRPFCPINVSFILFS